MEGNTYPEQQEERQRSRFPVSYIKSLDIPGVKILHLPANAVPAVFDLPVHAGHLLGLKTVHFSQQVFVQGLLFFFLGSRHKRMKAQSPSISSAFACVTCPKCAQNTPLERCCFAHLSCFGLQFLLLPSDLLLQAADLHFEAFDL